MSTQGHNTEASQGTYAARGVMRQSWTEKLPTDSGIYFVRTWNPMRNEWVVSAAKVVETDDALHAHIAGWSDSQRVGACSQGREWAGPLELPSESSSENAGSKHGQQSHAPTEEELEFVALANRVEALAASSADWKTKYDAVFSTMVSKRISVLARKVGIKVDYLGTQTSYRDEVLAYEDAVTSARDRWLKLYT